MCMTYLVGPIAGAVVNFFDCRVCTILGSILTSLGLIISRFSPTINIFILSYGVLTGMYNYYIHITFMLSSNI